MQGVAGAPAAPAAMRSVRKRRALALQASIIGPLPENVPRTLASGGPLKRGAGVRMPFLDKPPRTGGDGAMAR